MKKLILFAMTLMITVFQAQPSFAAPEYSQCTPTMSVDEARAEYEAGLKSITATLNDEYSRALTEYNNRSSQAFSEHTQRMDSIASQYAYEVDEIRENLEPGWQQALEEAVHRHNDYVDKANEDYRAQNEFNLKNYNEQTEKARQDYNTQADILTENYNRAVCAAKI